MTFCLIVLSIALGCSAEKENAITPNSSSKKEREPGRYYGENYSINFPGGWKVAQEGESTTAALSP